MAIMNITRSRVCAFNTVHFRGLRYTCQVPAATFTPAYENDKLVWNA